MAEKEEKRGEGLGISGFTLGVLSIILAGSVGIIISIVGFIFCIIQQKKNPIKLGKIGMILNIIGFVASIIFLIVSILLLGTLMQQNNLLTGVGA